MENGEEICGTCGQPIERLADPKSISGDRCTECGSPLDRKALSDFASRLARFGLGDTPLPLRSRLPEFPDAK